MFHSAEHDERCVHPVLHGRPTHFVAFEKRRALNLLPDLQLPLAGLQNVLDRNLPVEHEYLRGTLGAVDAGRSNSNSCIVSLFSSSAYGLGNDATRPPILLKPATRLKHRRMTLDRRQVQPKRVINPAVTPQHDVCSTPKQAKSNAASA